jgi:hypothetical protein
MEFLIISLLIGILSAHFMDALAQLAHPKAPSLRENGEELKSPEYQNVIVANKLRSEAPLVPNRKPSNIDEPA